MTLTRRELVGFAATTAACLCVGGASVALAGEHELLRPPGARNEADFIASCIKCDRCRSVCPTGAISVARLEDGLLNTRTPIMNFHQGICDFCDLCARVCMTGAIEHGFDPTQDKIGVAIVQKDRCLAYSLDCTNCENSCAYDALVFDSKRHPQIDAELCNGCGVCEYDCTALVYGTFSGGNRRGIVVVPLAEYERIGSTLVDGNEASALEEVEA